jgi:hypothetical protein
VAGSLANGLAVWRVCPSPAPPAPLTRPGGPILTLAQGCERSTAKLRRGPVGRLERYLGVVADDRDKPDSPSGPDLSLVPSGEHSDEQALQADDEVLSDDLDVDVFGLDPDDEDGEEPADAADSGRTALPPKVDAWRRRSATGAILTGFAMGLQQVFEKEKQEPAIVMQTSGDPPSDLPVEAEVERARPRQSVVNIRPWLLGGNGTADATSSNRNPAPSDRAGDDPATSDPAGSGPVAAGQADSVAEEDPEDS